MIVIGVIGGAIALGGAGFAYWYYFGQQNDLKARRQARRQRLKNIANKIKNRK